MWALLRVRVWRRWTIASFLARLPQPMSLLAFQIAGLHATGSLGKGALLVGITGFCGLLGPWSGRRRDRGSMRRHLQVSCVIGACALAGLAASVEWRAPYGVLVVLAIMQGSAIAGTWAGFRALLVVVAPEDLVHRAHFVESLMVEVSYGIGPLLVTGIVAVDGVTAPLVAMALAEVVAIVALQGVPDLDGRTERPARHSAANFAKKPVLAISSLGFVLALGFALIESNVPARMSQFGASPSDAGIYMAVLAAGSCLGGLLVSLRPLSHRRPGLQAGVLFGLFGLLSLPSALVGSPLAYLLLLPVNSLMLVPLNGLCAGEIERRVGLDGRGEAFGWLNTATRLGSGSGATLNGLLLSVIMPARIPLMASTLFLAMPVLLLFVWIGNKKAVAGSRGGPVTSNQQSSDSSCE